MKHLVVLSALIAACAASAIKDPSKGLVESFRSVYLPEHDSLNAVETLDPSDNEEHERNAEETEYILYTRSNPTVGQTVRFLDGDSIIYSNFRHFGTIVFLVHGHNGDGHDRMSTWLRDVFLREADVNVIVVDWRRLAGRSYISAKNGVPAVGRHFGQLINWLVSAFGAYYERMHIVGFNLGAHVAGNAGRATGSLVRRITALEPSGALWSRDSERLTPYDAQYVEAIHTNSEYLLTSDRTGDADFFPNGGSSQPGCLTNSCSQNRVVDLMAASVSYNNLNANECASVREANRNRCSGPLYPMGNSDLNKGRSGIFRVNTGRTYPFA